MNKTLIFVSAGSLLVGGVLGFFVGRHALKDKLIKETDERVKKAVDTYNEYLEEAYTAMEEDLDDDETIVINDIPAEPEEAEEEAEEKIEMSVSNKITMMKKDDWDTDFPQDDFEREELWFFPDDGLGVLTDEDGEVLEPIERFVSNIFNKTGFPQNDWIEIYICNNALEKHFWIHKEKDISRHDFFNY